MMDIHQILKKLPHRYPFLLVDRVLEIDKSQQRIRALKNVTMNEPFFEGHFPSRPVMPGVMMLEAMAQAAAILAFDKIGVLPESAGYPLHQSGEEFVQYFARLFGQSRKSARETAKTLLAEVGLAERAASPISMYSRGMRQRLGVARALVNRPRVLFLDEPTLGLDPAGQRQILALISEAATERGATVILSTHFLDEVEEVCSRVIILNRGEVIAEGPVEDIKRRAAPRTARVRVPEENHESALSALKRAPGVGDAQAVNGGRGLISATLDCPDTNAPIRALLGAGIPILSFEVEGGKLSDAFLALTGEAGE